jgi:hypothetical protein
MTVRFARCLLVSFACGCSVAPPPAGEVDAEQRVADSAPVTCESHDDCADGERCQLVDIPAGPGIAPVYVDDPVAIARTARAQVAEGRGPQKAAQPECDGDCAPYSGDLTVRPAKPLAMCSLSVLK